MSTLSDVLKAAGESALALAPALPGAGATVASITGLALQAASAIAAGGADPVPEIRRLLSSHDAVARVHAEWDVALAAKFGAGP